MRNKGNVKVLSLQSVCKRFGGFYALRDINLDVTQGERLALIGPNGAGKTTLFNLINGDLRATAGKIFLFGQDVTRAPVRRRVAMGIRRTYQKSSLFDSLTVGENLYLGILGPQTKKKRGHYNMVGSVRKDKERLKHARAIAKAVSLEGKFDLPVGMLSHGERRQLELGLAIALEPSILMFDEPVSGLSSNERKVIVNMLKSLPSHITVLLIEHDMNVALSVSERVVVLHEGQIIREGSPEEISDDPKVKQIYLGYLGTRRTIHE